MRMVAYEAEGCAESDFCRNKTDDICVSRMRASQRRPDFTPKEGLTMREFQIPYLPADMLDHLVLDTCELEDLAERVVQPLNAADLESIPKGAVARQLISILSRINNVSSMLHSLTDDRIRNIVSALEADRPGDHKSVILVQQPTTKPLVRRRS